MPPLSTRTLSSHPPVKKIVQNMVVKHPASSCEVTVWRLNKVRIIVMVFKFDEREIVTPHQRAHLFIIMRAGRAGDALRIVVLPVDRYAKEERLGVNFRQRVQEQL